MTLQQINCTNDPNYISDIIPVMDIEFDGYHVHANGLNIPAIGINLGHRPDRWRALSQRMSGIGFDRLLRAPAVEGVRVPDSLIEAITGRPVEGIDEAPEDHLRLTRPAIGCFLSHLSVWRWMLDKNIESAIIFEDDATPAAHFDARRFRETVEMVRPDTGLIFLGRLIMDGLAEMPAQPGLARLYYFNGTFAYLITASACRYLLQHLLPMQAHIDHQISRLLVDQRHSFSAWHAEPSFFDPDWSLGSDCHVPMADEPAADCKLQAYFVATRRKLLSEGRAVR